MFDDHLWRGKKGKLITLPLQGGTFCKSFAAFGKK